MRITLSLLCFSIIFSAAPAADPPPSPTDTYLAARDHFIAEFKDKDTADQRIAAARKDVERLLRAAIPSWTAPGFSVTSSINIGSSLDDPGAQGFSVLNGLVYSAGDTQVIVSNRVLLRHWLTEYNASAIGPGELSLASWIKDHNGGRAKVRVSTSIPVAFRSENFWTFALASRAAVHLRGMVLVKGVSGNDLAMAEVGLFAPYEATDLDADTLFVAVVRGDRVFVAHQKLATATTPIPFCKKALDATLVRARAEKAADKSNEIEEKAGREYRACFAQHLTEQKGYAAIQKQAQMLVDLLR